MIPPMDNATPPATTPTGEQSASVAAPTPTAPTGEQSAATGLSSQIAGLNREDLQGLIATIEPGRNDEPQQEQPAPAEAQAEANPPDSADNDDGDEVIETPPAEGAPEGTPPTKELNRVSVRGLEPEQRQIVARAAEMVRKGEYPDIASAVGPATLEITGKPAAAPVTQATTEPPPQTAPPVTEASAEVSELETQLGNLQDSLTQAILEYDKIGEARIQREIIDVNRKLASAEVRAEKAKEQSVRAQAVYDESVSRMEAKYAEQLKEPDFFNTLNDRVLAAQARQEKAGKPPLEITDPGYVERLADEVHSLLNGKPAAPAQAPAPPKPATAARPVGSSVAPGSSTARPTPDQVRQSVRTASRDDLAAVVASMG